MLKIITIIFGLISPFNLYSQVDHKNIDKPVNLEESLDYLNLILSDSDKVKIQSFTEDEFLSKSHFGLGMWIRNELLYNRYFFGLIVTQSELRKNLESLGLPTNDDMSSVILKSYYRKLNNLYLRVNQQINEIHQMYVNLNNPEWRMEQDSLYWMNLMSHFKLGDTVYNNLYYDRNWLGDPRKNSKIYGLITEKSDKKLRIKIIDYGENGDPELILEELKCNTEDCWVSPYWWKLAK